ncbi:hypothetical protein Cfor_07254 [Coptotermes formosanus]|uniref:Ionotropic glutamate receptor C-terminal domain-containing protein n=1 Tax=Coptotermes formosanus TaxID=36987 RepID=A0A6L2PW27_COPFO|nr:hypothetical protein Cfor_07254 [Coptotermes formosanus]
MMCLILCLLTVLHHVLAGSALSHDKQLVFLYTFCNQQLCSSMVLFDITEWWNVSLTEYKFVKFMSQLNQRVLVTSTQSWPSCQPLPDSAGKTPLLVLPYSASPQQHKFLKQCSQEGQFSGRITWLFLTSKSLSSDLFHSLTYLTIRLDSNVFIAVYDMEANVQLMEIYTLGPDTNIHYILSEWTVNSLFLPPLPYKYSKYRHGNLQGYQLRATTVLINEFYAHIKNTGDHFQVTGGYFGEAFTTLAATLNFSYSVMYLPGYSYGNTPTDNTSSWTGMIGVFQRQEADISICEISVTTERLQVMDFSLPLHTAVTRLYVREGMKEPSIAWYFQPFEISTWLILIMGVLLFTSINTLFHHIMYRLLRATRRAGLLSNLFTFVTIMLQQGADYPSNFSVRLVQQSSAFLFLVAHIGYSAKLTSLAALHRPQPPLSQLADILKSSTWKFGVMNASLLFNIFKASCNDCIYGKLWHQKLQPFPEHLMSSYKSGLSAVLAESHFAFMALEDSCQDTLQHSFSCTQASQILALPQTYFRGGLSFALQRNSQYKEVINYSLIKMKSSGILRRLQLTWVPQPQQCNTMLRVITEWTDIVPPVTGVRPGTFTAAGHGVKHCKTITQELDVLSQSLIATTKI